MPRSIWKGSFINYNLYYNFFFKKNKEITISNLSACTVVPKFLNNSFTLHNGKGTRGIFITKNMINRKFGVFVKTKKSIIHTTKKK